MRLIQDHTTSRARTSEFISSARNLRRVLVALWHRLALDHVSPYRPEKYYMRGAGPKSHRKEGERRMKVRAR